MSVLNLTQHVATPDQIAAGVIEPRDKKQVQDLLTFEGVPSHRDIYDSARALSKIAADHGVEYAMIGGAPYLMSALENALEGFMIEHVYACSDRVSVETVDPATGSTLKTSMFKHVGFYPPLPVRRF